MLILLEEKIMKSVILLRIERKQYSFVWLLTKEIFEIITNGTMSFIENKLGLTVVSVHSL